MGMVTIIGTTWNATASTTYNIIFSLKILDFVHCYETFLYDARLGESHNADEVRFQCNQEYCTAGSTNIA